MTDQPKLEDFAFRTYDKLRYGDTDRQGHVNNAVFATFLETGRVELIEGRSWRDGTASFVIARLEIDYVAEVLWPGTVDIGTSVEEGGAEFGGADASGIPGRAAGGDGRDGHCLCR